MNPVSCRDCRPGWQFIRTLLEEDDPNRGRQIAAYVDAFHHQDHDFDATRKFFLSAVAREEEARQARLEDDITRISRLIYGAVISDIFAERKDAR